MSLCLANSRSTGNVNFATEESDSVRLPYALDSTLSREVHSNSHIDCNRRSVNCRKENREQKTKQRQAQHQQHLPPPTFLQLLPSPILASAALPMLLLTSATAILLLLQTAVRRLLQREEYSSAQQHRAGSDDEHRSSRMHICVLYF